MPDHPAADRVQASAARIGVVVKTFPKLSETFILEELLGLEQAGVRFDLFSLRTPTDAVSNPENALLDATLDYVPSGPRLVGRLMRVVFRRPLRTIRAVGRVAWHRDEGWTDALLQAAWLAVEGLDRELECFHVHFIDYPTTVVELASAMSGIGFSVSAHAKDIYLSPGAVLRRKIAAARFVVTCTEHNRRHLAELAAPGSRVECVHHGVALERFRAAPDHRRATPEAPVILAVGRLRAKKGFDLLIDACERLRRDGHRFECRIVGYGPERDALAERISAAGLDGHVRLLGKLTRPEVIDHYGEATMLVQPCRIESTGDRDGIPNVLIEAMAGGVPVISTTVSGIPELVEHEHNGLLVDPDDAAALAEAMRTLLDDPDLGQRLADAARTRVIEAFDATSSAAIIAQMLQPPRIGYVLKGYPRLSELFIASEIHRVEQLGTPLRLFVIKEPDEHRRHDVIGRIRAEPQYLPAMSSVSGTPAWRWTAENIGAYATPLRRVACARPAGFAKAAGLAFAQAWRSRRGRWPRKVYLKEFFQASAVAAGAIEDDLTHLHAHFSHGSTTVAWLASTMSGCTYSFTAHAKDIYNEALNPAGLLARKVSGATFVATCTAANRRHLLSLCLGGNVRLIYHGLNADFVRLDDGAGPRERCDDRFRVLAVGRLVEKKGLDVLIAAAERALDHGVDIDVRIAGEEGPHGLVLRDMVRSRGLDERVTFLGPMDQRELIGEYRRADVFCLPCRVLADGDRDGIPNVLMEALAVGLPVVTTPISGIPELVEDRVNGLLVPSDDVEATAKALVELAREESMRFGLGTTGQADVAARFDALAEAREMVELLNRSATTGSAR